MSTDVLAFAQSMDEIWIEPPSAPNVERFTPQQIVRQKVRIASLDEQSLVFVPESDTTGESKNGPGDDHASSSPIQVASSRLIWVEPGFEDAETNEAIKIYRSGEAKDAIAPLLSAINRRPPVWKAQWLSMHLWQAAFEAERYPATLELVDQIDALPLPALILGGLPIHWPSGRMPKAAVDAAQRVIDANESRLATRLVAASWLIGQPGDAQAVAILESLTRQNQRPQIALIAKTLLWKTVTPPTLLENHLRWKASLSMLPMTLTQGPMFVLADRLESAGNKESSLEGMLSLALTPVRPHPITVIAKMRVSDHVELAGPSP